jgi:hypothetical protein
MKKCIYCDKDLTFTNYDYFVYRKAIKPPYTPHRWENAGYVCNSCEIEGKPTQEDKWCK